MEERAVALERICAPLKSFRNAAPVIRWHHEKQDGSGYADHWKGEEIRLTARILQTVDLYDSPTSDRPYRQALSEERALEIMWQQTRRGRRDAKRMSALEGSLTEYPLALSARRVAAGLIPEIQATTREGTQGVRGAVATKSQAPRSLRKLTSRFQIADEKSGRGE
jgi:HD-GYP domain-containing protein (c-di-GMP phosphodiesterase class II)